MTTSQRFALSVFLMKPRLSGHHVYVGKAPSSFAISSASLFSNPSSFSFEYGKLLGSAQTRNSFVRPCAAAPPADRTSTATRSAKAMAKDTVSSRRRLPRLARGAGDEFARAAREGRLGE